MAHYLARSLFFLVLTAFTFGALGSESPGLPVLPVLAPAAFQGTTDQTVIIAGEMEPENFLILSAAVAAADPPAVLLMDSPLAEIAHRSFLAAFRPDQIIPVGDFPAGIIDLERRLDVVVKPRVAMNHGLPRELRRFLLPSPERVVVCPVEPRGRLLQAACLAGSAGAPLFVIRGRGDEMELRSCLEEKRSCTVYAVGPTAALCRGLPEVTVSELPDKESVAVAYRRYLRRQGMIRSLVVANAEDHKQDRGTMSLLAPWIAVQRRAPLVLTNKYGDDVEEVVNGVLKDRNLKSVDSLILAATLKAIPMERRPNPLPDGKDVFIEMEPFTPQGFEPYTFAVGRLFHDDVAVVPAMLARQRLLLSDANGKPRTLKALVASNSGGGLPLLEAFSRNTVQELRNAGYETTALFGRQVTCDELRRLLPEHNLFLWEGHHNTLIRDWMFPDWKEPLPPSLVFLQSCLALSEWKALPLFQRGAVAVIGSSTRVFSGSGGACSLAFFDAMLYEDQSLGGSLRQAKNFLVCYGLLKEKRLGPESKGGGPTLRSAWAFTLWGDPTLTLPKPQPPSDALPPVHHKVQGNTIVLELPKESLNKVITARYQAQMFPNARLGGLLRKDAHEDDGQPLVPFVFAEVRLPKAPVGKIPHLKSRLPSNCWVFTWDARRNTGYVLATPRAKDQEELRFTVEWRD